MLAFGQGDTEESPMPAPRAIRMMDKAPAANAPDHTADHETPEEGASLWVVIGK